MRTRRSSRSVCEYTHLAGTTGRSAQCVTLSPIVCWKFLRATTSIADKRLICRFGVIREEVAIICVRNFLLTEGKVYKLMFIPVLFCLVLLKHLHLFPAMLICLNSHQSLQSRRYWGTLWKEVGIMPARHTTFFWSVFQSPACLTSLDPPLHSM